VPFVFEQSAAGANGGAGGATDAPAAGGAGGTAPAAPCSVQIDVPAGVVCSGNAIVQLLTTGPAFRFDASSRVRWDTSDVPNAVAPPSVVDGQSVWVDYANQSHVVCPFCGEYQRATMTIRDHQGGQLLWVGQEGHLLQDIDATLETELFGVPVLATAACTIDGMAGCYAVQRQEFDHEVETVPAQRVPRATKTQISTPNGNYQLFWTLSVDTTATVPLCADGPDVAHDTGFAASRLLP
jgi:hypothetical protein